MFTLNIAKKIEWLLVTSVEADRRVFWGQRIKRSWIPTESQKFNISLKKLVQRWDKTLCPTIFTKCRWCLYILIYVIERHFTATSLKLGFRFWVGCKLKFSDHFGHKLCPSSSKNKVSQVQLTARLFKGTGACATCLQRLICMQILWGFIPMARM